MRNLTVILLCSFLAACGRPSGDVAEASPAISERPASARSAPPAEVAAAKAVQMPTREALTDGAITGQIHSALVADPAMSGADVSVNTDKGVVVLSGTVQTHEQTGIASAHAQKQDGVLRVDNQLRPAYS